MPVGGLNLTVRSYPVGEESVGNVAIPGWLAVSLPLIAVAPPVTVRDSIVVGL